MDPAEVLPVELVLRVLSHLGPAELCRCLAVSSRWRHLADSECLWRAFCQQRRLQHSPTSDGGDGGLTLCPSAAAYIRHMSRLVGNWSSGTFQSYRLEKEDWYCCIASTGQLLAVYYPRPQLVRLYRADREMEPVCELSVSCLGAQLTAIPDLQLTDDDRLVVSRGGVVLVRPLSGHRPGKCLALAEDGRLSVSEPGPPQPANHRRLYVKLLVRDWLWLESDTLFVVNLNDNSCRVLEDSFRSLRWDGRLVLAANDAVTAFSPDGETVFKLSVAGVADLWPAGDVLALLVGAADQRLELWSLSGRRLERTVPLSAKDPSLVLTPDRLYLLEFGEGRLELSCLSTATASRLWALRAPFPRELTLHPELRLLCERFLFVRPSDTDDRNFLLVDCGSGRLLYDGPMPPSLCPPAYIYHLSDELFVTAENTVIHVRRYL